MRILLAEDDQNIAMLMRLCLEKIGGHTVTSVEDGEAALRTSQINVFDLFILDGMMPKKSGAEVARELRARGSMTPIIFLSAKSEDSEFQKLGNGFIAKPFEPTAICARIDEILAKRKSS